MTEQTKSYGNAAFLTLLLAGLYLALQQIPVPTTAHAFSMNPVWFNKYLSDLNILSVGLRPVISGFIVAEVLSLILPPLNRWRLEGTAGREKLNRWAWYFTTFFSVLNSWGTSYLVKIDLGSYGPAPGDSHVTFHIMNIAALAGGTAMTVLIARLITRYGVFNGYLALVLTDDLVSVLKYLPKHLKAYSGTHPLGEQNVVVLWMAIVLVAFAVYLWRFLGQGPRLSIPYKADKELSFEFSPFPSSGNLQGFVLTALGSAAYILGGFHIGHSWMDHGWTHLVLELTLMALLGTVFYNWFWGDIDLFGTRVADLPKHFPKMEGSMDRHFYRSLALLLGGTALFWISIGPEKMLSLDSFVSFLYLIWDFVILQDLYAQWGFWKVHGRGVEVMELDNMVLASYLKGLFEAEGIPCHFQSFRFRLVMLWLKPLYKVRLLVPEGEIERAQKLIAQVPHQVV